MTEQVAGWVWHQGPECHPNCALPCIRLVEAQGGRLAHSNKCLLSTGVNVCVCVLESSQPPGSKNGR